DLIRRLKRSGRYRFIGEATATTSMRRYEQRGVGRVVWLWTRLWVESLFRDLHDRRYETVGCNRREVIRRVTRPADLQTNRRPGNLLLFNCLRAMRRNYTERRSRARRRRISQRQRARSGPEKNPNTVNGYCCNPSNLC